MKPTEDIDEKELRSCLHRMEELTQFIEDRICHIRNTGVVEMDLTALCAYAEHLRVWLNFLTRLIWEGNAHNESAHLLHCPEPPREEGQNSNGRGV